MADSIDNPFKYPDADVILRSADDVNLKLHKSILAVASPFFNTLFSLPQPSIKSSVTISLPDDESPLPVVGVSEDGRTLCNLFRLVYPIPNPALDSLPDVAAVMGAAKKYEVEQAFAIAHKRMSTFVNSDPVRSYILACYYKDTKIARAAARACRRLPSVVVYAQEMSLVTAMDYYRLLAYQSQNVQDLFTNYSWIPRGIPSVAEDAGTQADVIVWDTTQKPAWFRCTTCQPSPKEAGGYWRGEEGGRTSQWWDNYMDRVATELRTYDTQDGGCAVSSQNITQALQEGSTCTGGCAADEAVQAFHAFSRYLAGEIDKKVYIELEF
jgi:hypothetical protein